MIHLDQLLDGLDVAVESFAICEVRDDAQMLLQEAEETSIHYILSGVGSARPTTGGEVALAPHTLIVAPPGTGVVIASEPVGEKHMAPPSCQTLPGGWEKATIGGGAPGLTLACGIVRATHLQCAGLFDYLRSPLIESMSEETTFREPFRQLLGELAQPQAGTRSLAELLMKQCLIALLRRQAQAGQCLAPWLAAHAQPHLGAALRAMLDRPAEPHSVQSLAELAGMSRSAFADQFKQAFARTPMEFLKGVRLRRAASLLSATDLPVKVVAARVGFDSRSYFSRTFKAFAGVDPAGFRARAGTN